MTKTNTSKKWRNVTCDQTLTIEGYKDRNLITVEGLSNNIEDVQL